MPRCLVRMARRGRRAWSCRAGRRRWASGCGRPAWSRSTARGSRPPRVVRRVGRSAPRRRARRAGSDMGRPPRGAASGGCSTRIAGPIGDVTSSRWADTRAGEDPDDIAVSGGIHDGAQQLERLRRSQDRARDGGGSRDRFLRQLGSHVAAVRQALGADHGQRDVQRHAGRQLSAGEVAARDHEVLEHGVIIERRGHLRRRRPRRRRRPPPPGRCGSPC